MPQSSIALPLPGSPFDPEQSVLFVVPPLEEFVSDEDLLVHVVQQTPFMPIDPCLVMSGIGGPQGVEAGIFQLVDSVPNLNAGISSSTEMINRVRRHISAYTRGYRCCRLRRSCVPGRGLPEVARNASFERVRRRIDWGREAAGW